MSTYEVEAMNNLEEMKKKYEELGEAIKRLEEKPAEWPQVGDGYFSGAFNVHGVRELYYRNDDCDKFLKALGDMHRTKEEAEAYRKFRMNPRTVMRDKIQMFVNEYNGGERGRYEVDSLGEIKELLCYPFNPFAMKDRKGAELLLEKFGLANILWACGGPEPGGE